MSGSSLNSQIVYGWSSSSQPVKTKIEEKEESLVSHEDFLNGLGTAEEALGQKILQDNNDKLRILELVTEQGFADLPIDGSATNIQISIAINSIQTVLTNLVIAGKE